MQSDIITNILNDTLINTTLPVKKLVPNTDIETMRCYMDKTGSKLTRTERHEILQMIVNDPDIDVSKISIKGDGTQIRYSDITDRTIINIYNFTKNKMAEKQEALQKLAV